MVNVGMDIGYGEVKVIKGSGEKKYSSAVVPYRESYGFDFPSSSDIVELEGKKYIISSSRSLDTRTRDYHRTDLWKVLFLYGIKDDVAVNVVLGLPVSYARKEERKELEERIKGEHVLKINGNEKKVRVSDAKVIAQGMGVLLDYFIDGFRVNEERKSESVLVFDIGFYTTDVFVYQDEGIEEERSRSVEVGVSHLFEDVLRWLTVEKGYPSVSIKEVERFFRNGYVKIKGEKVPLPRELFIKSWAEKLSDLLKFYEREIYTFDTLILAGGGAHFLREEFFGRKVVVPERPEFANARGYYKFARIRWG